MNPWQKWLQQPQSVWMRKALFQVHLWTGIGAGLYIFVVCVSGSALVFRPELATAFTPDPIVVAGTGAPLTDEQLTEKVLQANPGYRVRNVWRAKEPNVAVEIWLENAEGQRNRLVHPFTGDDLGPSVPFSMRAITWLLDLHDNLLAGETGRRVNGLGGFLLLIMCLTGAVIWWPGVRNWRRSLTLHRGVSWKRVMWDLHSALGFWTFAFIFMWAFTGFYIVFQESFAPLVDWIEPYDEVTFEPRRIDEVLVWLPRLHFGRFRQLGPTLSLAVKYLWVVIGLVPALLFVTGGIMWWNRVIRRSGRAAATPSRLSA
jgi:uncharacterized iron-regulated membrane protein